MGFEIDWRMLFNVVSSILGLVASVLVFMLARVFVKKEPFDALEKRVQSVEQTYVPKKDFDDLEKRLVKLETAIESLPQLVRELNDKVIRIESTAKHFDATIKRLEHPINLIVEAAMRGK
jgi:septal ring factor EnvC (AmiA/AmiB activator)